MQQQASYQQQYEGEVDICAHRVMFRYWDFHAPLTDELIERLNQEAEQRAKAMIVEGYHSGELNHLESDTDEEIRGWWEIIRD